MSRIDEALRRGGDRVSRFPEAGAADDKVFASPWTLGDEKALSRAPIDSGESHASVRSSQGLDFPASPALGAPPVRRSALVDRFRPDWRGRLAVSPNADQVLVEQVRRLAATLLQKQRSDGLKSVMIASATPGDGKTLTAVNLALILSESYRDHVLLVDGDMRRPMIGNVAGLNGADGLTEVIKASDDRKASLVELTETLKVLPGGGPEPDPLSYLTSPRIQQLLQEATAKFDWVIVDSPPAAGTADAGLLCAMVDAAILVVRAGETTHAAVQRAVEALGRERILGVVLNAVQKEVVPAEGYYPYPQSNAAN
jgi:capsular exopolysaccharide synthesis family protein